MRVSSLVLGFVVAPLLVACDPQADGEYQGEALFELSGTVTNDREEAPDSAEVTLVWEVTSGSPDTVVAEGVPVTGEFPASFHLELLEPPSEDSLNDYSYNGANEARIGVAYITVLAADVSAEELDDDDLLGIAESQLLVYVDRDVQEGTFSAELLGGTLSKGYHLMGVDPVTEEEVAAGDACRDAANEAQDWEAWEECGGIFDQMYEVDASTPVSVRLDESDNLIFPNWT